MITIDLDLGNTPSILEALQNERTAQLAVNAAAESYVDDIHNWVGGGNAFTGRTGALQQSINWQPTGGGTSVVFANAAYAKYVEEGTRAHVILPRNGKALKIPTAGGYILRRKVNHPGSRPFPYFFADLEAREQRMIARATSVLMSTANV